ncbi:MAG: PfkB family carbohydrate kinase [Planctomycetaceae bacterium]|jgi:sugar/nucleoside kinase (ribokinase family)|nr:PfkB family carbohydrate kinase [Planctomycetaceae bacterium]
MSLLIVGSVAFDTIETPTTSRDNILGGSATFASVAAAFFHPVQVVAVVGGDWEKSHTQRLEKRGIDVSGIEIVKDGKTFRWSGKYLENMNDRETLDTQLNVLGDFQPKLPDKFRRAKYVLLANGSTKTQHEVVDQLLGPELVIADTMNLWINIEHDELLRLMKRIDGLVLNDSEAKMLTGEANTVTAGRKLLTMGPKFVIVKKGEHGAFFFAEYETYIVPAFPTENLVDPTGAGDSFAGAMLGYIASVGNTDPETIKRSLAYGAIVAAAAVEGFSIEQLEQLNRDTVEQRMSEFRKMTSF